MAMEEGAEALSPHQHFVLVHGAGHGAWCWYKLRLLLEDAGHKVTCLDLASAGIDRSDPNLIFAFDDYNRPLLDFLSQLPENDQIILVGHSAGGQSVTQAIYKFGSKIKLAIYVAATMLRAGLSTEQDIKEGVPDLSRYGDVLELEYGLGPGHPPTSGSMRKEFQRMILSQLSPKEDSLLASMLLQWWPSVALDGAMFGGDDGSVDLVRRVFVKTAHDQMLLLEQQEAMIRRWPPTSVATVDSDHSPFFSAPAQLFQALIQASASSP